MSERNTGPSGLNLENLRKQAKSLLKRYRAGDADALTRVRTYFKPQTRVGLKRVQLVIARDAGFASWNALRAALAVPDNFDNELTEALGSGDPDVVTAAFDRLDLAAVGDTDINRLLQLVASYGYSGRTDRYASVIAGLLHHWEPDLGTCALLGLTKEATAHLRRGPEALSSVNDEGATPLHGAHQGRHRRQRARRVWPNAARPRDARRPSQTGACR